MSRPEYGSDLHLWNQPDEEQEHASTADARIEPFMSQSGNLEAVARSTDPATSWEAARSITPEKLGQDQHFILAKLRGFGPMTDEQLVRSVDGTMSPSGARTRRSELVAMGLVRDSGRKDTLRSGRRAIVWEAV